jgi:hypothetical protein
VGEQLKKWFGPNPELPDDFMAVAATLIVVGEGAFVDPQMMVEIEVDAWVF